MGRFREKITEYPAFSLFLLALAVRLAALAACPGCWLVPLNKDALFYHNLASDLLSGHGFVLDGELSARIPPFYPLFLAAVYGVTGFSRLAVVILQAILGASVAFFICRTGEQVFQGSRRIGIIAGAASAVYWPFIIIGMKLLSEALFIPLLAAGGYYTVMALRQRRPGPAAIAAALTALAVLTRPIVFYFPAVVAAAFAWDWFRKREKRVLYTVGVYLIVLALAQAPWIVRNYMVFERFIPSSTGGGMALYSGNLPREGKIFGYNLRAWQLTQSQQYILELPELERDRALKELAIEGLKKKPPAELTRLFLLKFLFFWAPFDWEVLGNPLGVFNPWYFWVLIFSLWWLLPPLSWRKEFFFPVAIIAYFMLICMVAYGSSRLRLPVEPYLLLLGAAGWCKIESWAPAVLRSFAGAAVLLTLVIGYCYGEQIEELGRALAVELGIW
ncbi:MAG: glycosyltransferase family 39 protein [Gemmatimonadota bacterium]|nr:glycosyltransferase family 39 protein [Gemmatimonadota bacterium]